LWNPFSTPAENKVSFAILGRDEVG